jgi:expansin (peptidoglycan-binding protein)
MNEGGVGTSRFLTGVFLVGLFHLTQAYSQCPTVPVVHSGQATFYTFADGGGACMFDPTPNDLMVGAMNAIDYNTSQACGECVSLTGPNATILIRIVDLCPECPQGNIDLSPLAFSKIADTTLGKVPITWQVIPCTVPGPIQYQFKDSSSQWWTAVQIRNHRYPILSLEYRDGGGTYHTINRTNYNYFVQSPGIGAGPYTFRVTDVYGHVLEDTGIPLVVGGTVSGNAQFPLCDNATSVQEQGFGGGRMPGVFELEQNYPNPFNPTTVVSWQLPVVSHVKLQICDVLGREIAVLVEGEQSAGRYRVQWNAAGLPGGVYFARLRAGNLSSTRKLVLLR